MDIIYSVKGYQKRGLSGLVAILALLSLAAIVTGTIWYLNSRATNSASEQINASDRGIAILTDPSICTDGVRVAIIQYPIKGDGTGLPRVREAYQISADIDERFWNADFTGDGASDKIIERVSPDKEAAIRAGRGWELHHQNAGFVVIANAERQRYAFNNDAENGTYDTILMLMFNTNDADKSNFHLAFSSTADPSPMGDNTRIPKEPSISIAKEIPNSSARSENFAYRYEISLNRDMACWTITRI